MDDGSTERETDATTFLPNAADVIRTVADTCHTGIITNGTSTLQRQKIDRLGVREQLQSIVISTEIGKRKPNAEFFEAAKQVLDGDTYIVVSHDLRRDILPAKRTGMTTIWITDTDDINDNPKIQELVDTTVQNLGDVPDAVAEYCP